MTIDKHKVFMKVALELAKLSKCQSKQVCAIAVKDGSIIETGINGTPRGYHVNCCDVFSVVTPENRHEHHKWSLANEIHAEQNLIARAAASSRDLSGAVIYVTLKPCLSCTLLLQAACIKTVYYLYDYDLGGQNREFEKFDGRITFEKIEL